MLNAGSIAKNLVTLPSHPESTGWPTENWPREAIVSKDNQRFDQLTNEVFDLAGPQGVTYALLVVRAGELIYERYDACANPFIYNTAGLWQRVSLMR